MLLFLSVSLSCSRTKGELTLSPPATPPLSRTYIGYAVVEESYVHIRTSPDDSGTSIGYFRQGSVLPALERRLVRVGGATETWLLVDGENKGWLREKSVRIFDTEGKAKNAARGDYK